MFVLTGFADEISPDLDVQVETLSRLGVKGLDLRGVDGKNVLELSEDELKRVQDACSAKGIHIQCIGSPVNKVVYAPGNEVQEKDKLLRAIRAATLLGVQRIRIFSPEATDEQAPQVLAWMSEQCKMARDAGVILIHENDARFWGAFPGNARRLFDELGSQYFRAVFDFANTVLIGYRPMDDWFPWLLPHLDTIHIKDARVDGTIVPAGEGDAQVVPTIRFLIQSGWNGPLTLEPHLKAAGPYGGFSGGELFEEAAIALRRVVSEAGGSC